MSTATARKSAAIKACIHMRVQHGAQPCQNRRQYITKYTLDHGVPHNQPQPRP